MRAAMSASSAQSAPWPQALKIQSTPPSSPVTSSMTKVGPKSRIQKLLSGASMISISVLSMRRARSRSVGSTTIVTGSKGTIACATAVQAA